MLSGCDPSTGPDKSDDPDRVTIASIEGLTPGETAEVRGENLESVETLTVDGEPVAFEPLSDTRGHFTVPRTRDCEVDGRRVEVGVNDRPPHQARMDVSSVLELEVAESRVISQEEFDCLKLGRGAEHYVLSVADFRTEPGPDRSPYGLVVHGSGERGATHEMLGGGSQATASTLPEHLDHTHTDDAPEAPNVAHGELPGVGPSEGPIDDYANAQMGDTVRMVDWSGTDWYYAETQEDVPTYEAIVVGVEGRQLVLVDTRDARAMEIVDNDEALETISQAARMIDDVIEPTLKTLFGPDFEIMDGAGGRMATLLRDRGSLGSPYRSEQDINYRRWASGMFAITVHPALADTSPDRANGMARVMAHEFGHIADATHKYDHGFERPYSGAGFYSEAIAVTTEDVAARLARGDLRDVPSPGPEGGLSARIEESPLVRAGELSPWGDVDGQRHMGWYTRGAQILRYAQSTMEPGEEWRVQLGLTERERKINETGQQRSEAFSIEAIAEEAGMSVRELLEKSMLADLTDGLVPQEAAEAQGLPQVKGWDRQDREDIGEWIQNFELAPVDRLREATTFETRIPAGGYAFRYVPGSESRGFSLAVEEREGASSNHEVRVTRLR